MRAKFDQIVQVDKIGKPDTMDLGELFKLAGGQMLQKPDVKEHWKVLVIGIDVQNCFMEGEPLGVPGSIKDVERMTRFIYNNIDKIDKIICSEDLHNVWQIFFPCWWKNKNGMNPDPYTVITYEEALSGMWKPVFGDPKKSLTYLAGLKEKGATPLQIWPYHALAGTFGQALEGQFAKMLHFYDYVKGGSKVQVFTKGSDPFSEMYGIIEPEYSERPMINKFILDEIRLYDQVYIFGEAASHCVMRSIEQIAEYYQNSYTILHKIVVLKDCMSPVVGFERTTPRKFCELEQRYGIRFRNSTDIIL